MVVLAGTVSAGKSRPSVAGIAVSALSASGATNKDRRSTFTDVMQIIGSVLDEVARATPDPHRPVA